MPYRHTIKAMELSIDLSRDDLRPYFLWDTEMTTGELRRRLREADEDERVLWVARIMREARYQDVWAFLSIDDILSRWDRLRGRLGRMNAFWEFLIRTWGAHGLISVY